VGESLGIHNVVSVANFLNNLCSKGVLSKCDTGKHGIRRLYFKFNPVVKDELKNGVKNMNLITVPNDLMEGVHPKVIEILSEISQIYISENKKLFSFPYPIRKVTKSIKVFNTQLLDILYGRYTRKKYFLKDEFLDKNEKLITDENYEMVKSCKGDWDKIRDLVITASENYSLWFNEDREPLSKTWLTRDIGMWIYNSMMQTSLFLACILHPPASIVQGLTKQIIKKLPDNVYEMAIKIKRDLFKNCSEQETDVFWFAISKVLKVERKLKAIYSDNYLVCLWLDYEHKGNWTCNYLQWLYTCWGEDTAKMLLTRHIGPKGKAWKNWFFSDGNLKDIASELYENSLEE